MYQFGITAFDHSPSRWYSIPSLSGPLISKKARVCCCSSIRLSYGAYRNRQVQPSSIPPKSLQRGSKTSAVHGAGAPTAKVPGLPRLDQPPRVPGGYSLRRSSVQGRSTICNSWRPTRSMAKTALEEPMSRPQIPATVVSPPPSK